MESFNVNNIYHYNFQKTIIVIIIIIIIDSNLRH